VREGYASFCTDDARPGLFADAIDCLTASSGDGICLGFGNPGSTAASCIESVYSDVEDSAVDVLVAAYNAKCGTSFVAEGFTPPLYALGREVLESTTTCIEQASDCPTVAMDCFGFQAELNRCFE